MHSFYKMSKCFKWLLKHLGYHFHHAVKPGVILLLLRKVTLLAWKSPRLDVAQVPAPLDVAGLSPGSVQDSSPAFPGGEQHCVKCHCTLGTQEEKTNSCKRSKRISEHNRWCRSSLNGENKHWLLFNCLSTCLLTSPTLGLGSVFSLCSFCALCMCHFPHVLGTLLFLPWLGNVVPLPVSSQYPLAGLFSFFLPFSVFIVISFNLSVS